MEQTLTILGATGYTGRLCVTEAVRRGQPIVIAGRRREALEEIAAAHADSGVPIEVAVADVGDADALRELAARSTTLLSTVGPYTKLGQGPVQACIESGCHYVDVTGEVEFMTWVYAQSERAAAKGVTLATGSGFDGVPGDLLAAMAAQALDRPVHSARVAYHVENARVSAGTARSALGALNRGGAVWRSGRVAQEPAAVEQWQVPFPEPQGPTLAVSAPLPEVVTVGRSIGADVVRAYFVIPAGRAVSSIAGPAQRVAALLSTTPLWGLLERGIDRLPDGPTAAQRAKTRTLVLAEVTGEGGVAAVQWATLNELYGATAVIAISAAQKLLEGTVPTGAVTPSTLFDAATLFAELGAEVGPP